VCSGDGEIDNDNDNNNQEEGNMNPRESFWWTQ